MHELFSRSNIWSVIPFFSGDHLREVEINVGETEHNMHLCSNFTGPGEAIVTITCLQPMLGRFVQLNKTINEGISLCEVEVYH